jgi:hypothetical protein
MDVCCCYLQIIGETVGEVRPVSDMHQRKAEMARQSDAFIALPGERCIALHFITVHCIPFLNFVRSRRQQDLHG